MEENQPSLLDAAIDVLKQNDQGTSTVPAHGLYPHQWLWDSCFIAIGQRHYDLDRAQTEILSLLKGQWSNGMLPHVIHSKTKNARDAHIWRSWMNPYSPDDISTSGITQPPVIAEAVVRIGGKMKKTERRRWYRKVYPHLLAYHEWLYEERDPHSEGLVLQIHPWETGLDSTPPWMQELHDHQMPVWIRAVGKLGLSPAFNIFRRDIRFAPADQRMTTLDALALYSVQRRLRRKNYDIRRILKHSHFAIEDVNFNAIFIRANQLLTDIAKDIKQDIPPELKADMKRTEEAFEQLWDPYSSQYYSREFVTHRLLKTPTIGTLLALYSGAISQERAKALVGLLEDPHQFGSMYPVPSVPINDEWFKPNTYWQGPSWVNMNWLIIDGLRRYGFDDHADALTETTIEMVEKSGFYEYFNPLDGTPAGTDRFSWTAALTIDLIKSQSQAQK